ncbi:hypothetical protein KKF34_04370 [Myxococcota bacterium]|nr:hypothetical protein [Myxococcota bacterium]MBU1380101.1 hypothetical protein [Myxococcota bacterium]MBU1496093.1 hypothetical protein [Myxococcota bacterium]
MKNLFIFAISFTLLLSSACDSDDKSTTHCEYPLLLTLDKNQCFAQTTDICVKTGNESFNNIVTSICKDTPDGTLYIHATVGLDILEDGWETCDQTISTAETFTEGDCLLHGDPEGGEYYFCAADSSMYLISEDENSCVASPYTFDSCLIINRVFANDVDVTYYCLETEEGTVVSQQFGAPMIDILSEGWAVCNFCFYKIPVEYCCTITD